LIENLDYKKFPILVVDDEVDNLTAFQMEFGDYFEILTAPGGKQALELLQKRGEVALIAVDQRMPEMRGVDVLKEVVRLYPDTVRFLVTAYSDIQVVVEAINAGNVYRYISKPWEHEDVKLSIMRAIETYYLTKERERLIEEKIKTVKKAADANRLASLGMLAAGIAHEINNPLVSINTFLKLMPSKFKELPLEKEGKFDSGFWDEFYRLAEGELKRVQDLVRELLNLAKPPKYDFEETNVEQLIRAEEKIFETASKEKNILFGIQVAANLPPLRCDRSRVKQLLLNLVLNAIQATSKGGKVSIEARLGPGINGGRQLEIRVIDTGEGIPPERIEKIFEPFFSTKSRGTGLGLMVCDFIVRHHGGDIKVYSEVGKGTTFVVSLPFQPAHSPASVQPVAS